MHHWAELIYWHISAYGDKYDRTQAPSSTAGSGATCLAGVKLIPGAVCSSIGQQFWYPFRSQGAFLKAGLRTRSPEHSCQSASMLQQTGGHIANSRPQRHQAPDTAAHPAVPYDALELQRGFTCTRIQPTGERPRANDCMAGKHSDTGRTLNPCELSGTRATGGLQSLRLSFHQRVWKSQSQHTGMRVASVGSRSRTHICKACSGLRACVWEAIERVPGMCVRVHRLVHVNSSAGIGRAAHGQETVQMWQLISVEKPMFCSVQAAPSHARACNHSLKQLNLQSLPPYNFSVFPHTDQLVMLKFQRHLNQWVSHQRQTICWFYVMFISTASMCRS